MGALRAKVKNGRLILNTPTRLPEGTVLDLVIDDEGDNLSPKERRALHRALDLAWREARAGKLRPASDVMARLRKRR